MTVPAQRKEGFLKSQESYLLMLFTKEISQMFCLLMLFHWTSDRSKQTKAMYEWRKETKKTKQKTKRVNRPYYPVISNFRAKGFPFFPFVQTAIFCLTHAVLSSLPKNSSIPFGGFYKYCTKSHKTLNGKSRWIVCVGTHRGFLFLLLLRCFYFAWLLRRTAFFISRRLLASA